MKKSVYVCVRETDRERKRERGREIDRERYKDRERKIERERKRGFVGDTGRA